MARKTPAERLAELETRQRVLKDDIRAARSQVRQQERKQDTRRKIIVGAVVLMRMESDPEFAADISRMLDRAVEQPRDRALLDLPERHETPANPTQMTP